MSEVAQGIQITLDQGTFAWLQISIWVVLAVTIVAALGWAYHFWVELHKTPKESKDIREAYNKKMPMMLLASDSGTGMTKVANRVGSEGYATTRPEGKWKFHHTQLFPRPGKVPNSINVDAAGGKDLSKTRTLAEQINKINTKKLILEGARVPLWVGVPSKGIVASVFAIAGIQITEEIETKWAAIKGVLGKEVPEIFPIDVSALKQMVVSSSYNASQINAIESDSEHIGEERATKKGLEKWFIIGGLAMMGIGVAALVAAALL